MKTKIKSIRIVALLTLIALFSCKKGDPGPPGLDGKDGKDGGNTNISVSTFTVTNWLWTSLNKRYEATINYNEINSNVINNGMVTVFLKNSFFQTESQLPFTTFADSTITSATAFSNGNIYLSIQRTDLKQISNPGSKEFKVVVTKPQ